MTSLVLALLLLPSPARAGADAPAARRAQAEYLRGTLLEKRGAYAEALAAYEKALEIDPSSAFVAGEAADLALELEDRERAEKWARRRLELAPKDAKSRVILGRVLWARGDSDGAEAELALAAKADPSSPDALFALTELVAGRDPKRARELIERFLKDNPEHAARALFELGRLDAQEERYAAAIDKLKRSIALDDSESGPARMVLAQVYEVRKDTPAAIAEFQRVLMDEPEDLDLWAHIGALQAAAGDVDEARATFLRLLEKAPGHPAAAAWLAADAERAGDFARAARLLEGSAELEEDPAAALRLGYYQLQSGGLDAAIATLEAARKRWPKDDRVAFYLALGYDDRGRRKDAARLLEEVLELKPGDRDARWQLAVISEKLGDIPAAETHFRKLIEEKPDDGPALNYLGYALADRGLKLPEAEALIRRALAAEPSNAAYRDSLGWVMFKLGRSSEAAAELEEAARSLPDDETAWEHLGEARRALGRGEDAWRAFRLAQSLGAKGAESKAEELEKSWSPEKRGELWVAHLRELHGGLVKLSALCRVTGKVGGRELSVTGLLAFRAPRTLELEIMGPLFAPAARARVNESGFEMDPFPVDGASEADVREAARGLLSAVAASLAAEPLAPGPAKLERGWSRTRVARPDWRVELAENGWARAYEPKDGAALRLEEFHKAGHKRIPKSFAAEGRFWRFALSCPEPKTEAR